MTVEPEKQAATKKNSANVPESFVDWENVITDRFPGQAALVDRVLVRHRDRCSSLARRYRAWFRITGVLTIVLSVSLPVLTGLTFPGRNVALSCLALGVAALSSLRAFYQWDQGWRLYRSQEFVLTSLHTRWQLGMLRIVETSAPDAEAAVHQLTDEILREAHGTGLGEIDQFFTGIGWPQRAN